MIDAESSLEKNVKRCANSKEHQLFIKLSLRLNLLLEYRPLFDISHHLQGKLTTCQLVLGLLSPVKVVADALSLPLGGHKQGLFEH